MYTAISRKKFKLKCTMVVLVWYGKKPSRVPNVTCEGHIVTVGLKCILFINTGNTMILDCTRNTVLESITNVECLASLKSYAP